MSDPEIPASSRQQSRYGILVRLIRRTLLFAAGMLVLLALAIGALIAFAIPIDLSGARQQIEAATSSALARPVHLDGSIILLPSLNPSLQVNNLRIGHAEGWPVSEFAQLGMLRVRFALLPLLKREMRIDEINLEGLSLNLEKNQAGQANWLLQNQDKSSSANNGAPVQFLELAKLTASDLNITYKDAVTGQAHAIHLDRMTGNAAQGQPVRLAIEGAVQDVAFTTNFTGGDLTSLLLAEKPWPADFSLTTLGADLQVKGTVEHPLKAASFSLAVDLQLPSTEKAKAFFQIKLPFMDKLRLQGQLEGTQSRLRFDGIRASIDDTEITARLGAVFAGEKPQLDGTLHVRHVDVSRLFAAIEKGNYSSREIQSSPTTQTEKNDLRQHSGQPSSIVSEWGLDTPLLDTDFLNLFNAQLNFAVDQVVGGPASISGVSMALNISNGNLTAPMTVQFAEVPFAGQVTLGTADDIPVLDLSLVAKSSEIGDLAMLLANNEGIAGRFGNARLNLSTRGKALRNLVETSILDFSLSAASLTYGNDTGGQPVKFSLNKLTMNYHPEQRSRVLAQGSLLDEPFSLQIQGGSFLDKFITKKWPVKISATGGGAQFNAQGLVSHEEETGLTFNLSGEKIGGLSRWLGISADSNYSYRVAGKLTSSRTLTRVEFTQGQLANSRFRGELGINKQNKTPLSTLRLHADMIDVDQLLTMFPESNSRPSTPGDERYALDAPILPRGITMLDSNIDLSIATLNTNLVMAKELRLTTQIRDGYVAGAPIRGVIAGARMEGNIGIDLRSSNPKFNLALKSGTFDVGKLLTGMGLIDSMTMTAEQLELSLALQGSNFRDMLRQSRLVATVQGGLWELNRFAMTESLDIVVNKARLIAYGQEPIALDLEGRIDETPLRLTLQTDSLASYAQAKQLIRIQAAGNLAQAGIQLSAVTPIPIQTEHLQVDLALGGKRISDLDELLGVSLPPWGPYALQGEFGTSTTGYYIRNLQLRMGQSKLNGDIELSMAQTPPRFTVELAANSVQLDDFKTGDWSVDGKLESTGNQSNATITVTDRLALLTPEVMHSMDAQLTVSVKEVVSGEDRLGHGNLQAKLEDGRLVVKPFSVGIPGGEVELAFELEPTATDIALRTDVKIENLDYGYLARRIDPESSVSGLISVDTRVSTRGPDLDTVMRNSNGHIDLAIWPQGLNARLFDLWSTNLLIDALSTVDRSADSKVNCVIARFRVEDGIMQPNVLFVDTTRVQASGDGVIDLKQQNLEFLVRPRPKRPQMFTAQTPVRIRGTFQDYSASASPGAIAGTVIRFITSPIVVPFQWMFNEQASADGELECREAWERKN
jgi:uncharacterized protein involved in outer membrane biogenesis